MNPLCSRCTTCGLYQQATNYVWGQGNEKSRVVFIGEAPGKEEDLRGLPFCGRSGALLDQLFAEIGLKREAVRITNTIRCRPPENRIDDRYVDCCEDFLCQELGLCRPQVIVTLGATASTWLQNRTQCEALGKVATVSRIQGQAYEIMTLLGRMIWIPMYHPAAALRDPARVNDMHNTFQILHDFLCRLGKLPMPV